MKLLAQIQPVPWTVESQWLWGLVGFMFIVALSLSTAVSIKKLWGRVPPIEQQFASRELVTALDTRITKLEEDMTELRAAILRSELKLTQHLGDMERSILLAGEQRAKSIHERIDHMLDKVAQS